MRNGSHGTCLDFRTSSVLSRPFSALPTTRSQSPVFGFLLCLLFPPYPILMCLSSFDALRSLPSCSQPFRTYGAFDVSFLLVLQTVHPASTELLVRCHCKLASCSKNSAEKRTSQTFGES